MSNDANDSDIDIYADLDLPLNENAASDLSSNENTANNSLIENTQSIKQQKEIRKLRKNIRLEKRKIRTLRTNMASLYFTGKNELERKNNRIIQLEKEKSNAFFEEYRKKYQSSSRKDETSRTVKLTENYSNTDVNDVTVKNNNQTHDRSTICNIRSNDNGQLNANPIGDSSSVIISSSFSSSNCPPSSTNNDEEVNKEIIKANKVVANLLNELGKINRAENNANNNDININNNNNTETTVSAIDRHEDWVNSLCHRIILSPIKDTPDMVKEKYHSERSSRHNRLSSDAIKNLTPLSFERETMPIRLTNDEIVQSNRSSMSTRKQRRMEHKSTRSRRQPYHYKYDDYSRRRRRSSSNRRRHGHREAEIDESRSEGKRSASTKKSCSLESGEINSNSESSRSINSNNDSSVDYRVRIDDCISSSNNDRHRRSVKLENRNNSNDSRSRIDRKSIRNVETNEIYYRGRDKIESEINHRKNEDKGSSVVLLDNVGELQQDHFDKSKRKLFACRRLTDDARLVYCLKLLK